jgi:hypothetical protein
MIRIGTAKPCHLECGALTMRRISLIVKPWKKRAASPIQIEAEAAVPDVAPR